jgi:hypothetical protein
MFHANFHVPPFRSLGIPLRDFDLADQPFNSHSKKEATGPTKRDSRARFGRAALEDQRRKYFISFT